MDRRSLSGCSNRALCSPSVAEDLHLWSRARPAARAQSSGDFADLTLAEAWARIRVRLVTPTQLTEVYLERTASYNPKLTAFITVMRD